MSKAKTNTTSRQYQLTKGSAAKLIAPLALEPHSRVLVLNGENTELVEIVVKAVLTVDVVTSDPDVSPPPGYNLLGAKGLQSAANRTYDVVIGNPPTGDLIAHHHTALPLLREGGRLVLLYRNNGLSAACREWFWRKCPANFVVQLRGSRWEDGIEHSYYSYSLFNWVKGVKATPRMPVYLESQIDLIEQAIASLVPLRMAA